jgi:hypothetical protein
MKIQITKKNLIITPAPKKNKKNGIRLSFARVEVPEYTTLPIMTTDAIKGQRKYTLPKDINYFIKSIEF